MEANKDTNNDLVRVCRKLSRYMMHLLVNHPSLLPLNKSAPYTLNHFYNQILHHLLSSMKNFTQLDLHPGKETLEEIKETWIRLIIYAAGKSRPEMHAAQLAMGGELLTFVWLQLGHRGFGPMDARIQLNLFYGTQYYLPLYYLYSSHHSSQVKFSVIYNQFDHCFILVLFKH
jgi:hypothetical protein